METLRYTPDVERVADVMLHAPTVSGPGVTVGELRAVFADEHVHAALVADHGRLLAVVERDDLDGVTDGVLARSVGTLRGRTVPPDLPVPVALRLLHRDARRRLAVVDGDRLVGLLALKRRGTGFCRDTDVAARRADPGADRTRPRAC